MSGWVAAFGPIVLALAVLDFWLFNYPSMRAEHRARQMFRREYDGWTTRWWWCWVWWFGLEKTTPRLLRQPGRFSNPQKKPE